jgi:hypothetical protein
MWAVESRTVSWLSMTKVSMTVCCLDAAENGGAFEPHVGNAVGRG